MNEERSGLETRAFKFYQEASMLAGIKKEWSDWDAENDTIKNWFRIAAKSKVNNEIKELVKEAIDNAFANIGEHKDTIICPGGRRSKSFQLSKEDMEKQLETMRRVYSDRYLDPFFYYAESLHKKEAKQRVYGDSHLEDAIPWFQVPFRHKVIRKMNIIEKINWAISEHIPNKRETLLAIESPLYVKQNALLYHNGNEPQKFFPDDTIDLIVGHLRTGGRKDNRATLWEAWNHEVELIAIGSHKYLDTVISGIESAGALVQSYDLRGGNIWKQYFSGLDEQPENQIFTIKYSINGRFEDLPVNACEK